MFKDFRKKLQDVVALVKLFLLTTASLMFLNSLLITVLILVVMLQQSDVVR